MLNSLQTAPISRHITVSCLARVQITLLFAYNNIHDGLLGIALCLSVKKRLSSKQNLVSSHQRQVAFCILEFKKKLAHSILI